MSNKEKKLSGSDLPPGWVMLSSKSNPTRKYYYNTLTRLTTWTHPCLGQELEKKEATQTDSNNPTKKSKSRKKRKKSKRKNLLTIEPNINIEDYDETQEQYFNSFDQGVGKRISNASVKKTQLKGLSGSSNDNKDKVKNNPGKSLEKQVVPEKRLLVAKESKASALDLIKKNYLKETSESKKVVGVGKRISQEKTDPITTTNKVSLSNGKIKKKTPQKQVTKKLDEAIKAVIKSEEGQSKELDFIKEKSAKFKRFTIPKKNVAQKINVLQEPVPETSENVKNIIDNAHDRHSNKNINNSIQNIEYSNTINDINNSLEPISTINNNIISNSCSSHFMAQENIVDFTEEMDWEPCDEEMDAKNINDFCSQIDTTRTISSDIHLQAMPDIVMMPSFSQSNLWLLILDTNVLISCLNFIKEMRDTSVSDLGLPIFYIPWRVLQELDHLKSVRRDYADKQLHMNARKAISYLNENFKSEHPRFCGQSYEDFSKISDGDSSADDDILKTCFQLKNLHSNKRVILMTNDKNLESKARVSNVEAYSKEGFQNKYLFSAQRNRIVETTAENSGYKSNDDMKRIDDFVCDLKNILKDFFALVVETEMKEAYDNDWLKICYRKPPWSLKDALDCVKKHWRAVFFLVFDRRILSGIDSLYVKLFQNQIKSSSGISGAVESIQKLLNYIKQKTKKVRPYVESVDSILNMINNAVIKYNSTGHSSQTAYEPTSVHTSNSSSLSYQTFSEDFNQVKDIFKWIWDSLKDYCDTLPSAITSTIDANVLETKRGVVQRHTELSKLIALLEEVVKLSSNEITEVHPLINHLSDFLVQSLSMADTELRVRLPKCLTVFFSSPEGRSLLEKSLGGFREFLQSLMRANEFIEGKYTVHI